MITKAQLEGIIKGAFDYVSDKNDITPTEARDHIAKEIANGVEQYVVGRQTIGTSSNGGTVTTTIQ